MLIRKRTYRICTIIIFVAILLLSSFQMVSAEEKASSYTYSFWGEPQPAPSAYELERNVRAEDIGIESIDNLTDLFYRNGKLYLTMNGQIVITDDNFKLIKVIKTYIDNGEEKQIKDPKGIFVTKDNEFYITEPDEGKILNFGADMEFIRSLANPNIEGLEGITYAPTKVVVDDIGRIYVQARSVYEGIIELAPDGSYNRFIGANEVTPSVVDIFWRMIATEEQLKRMNLWLPTDYSDIAIDKDGFLLATVKDSSSKKPIRKLNAKGDDITMEYDAVVRPMGDYINNSSVSILTNITCADDGRFAVLDAANYRVFVYSDDARLLYMLGGKGKREGSLNSPIDLTFMGDKILVANLVARCIEVFETTEYGALINEAAYTQTTFDYYKASDLWKKVLQINPNFNYGNIGIGKQQLRNENFEAAVTSFSKAYEREYYSDAYERVREEYLDNNFHYILLTILAFIILLIVVRHIKRYRAERGLRLEGKMGDFGRKLKYECITYPGYILSHPFKAFDDIKYEGTGNTVFGFIVLVAISFLSIVQWRYTSFLVAYINHDNINIPIQLISTICPYIIFIFANWSVSILLSGKGSMKDIFKVNMYALYPTVFLNLLAVILSNFIVLDEVALIRFLFGLSVVIYCFYTFIGLTVVHQYSFTRSVASIFISFVVMVIIVFMLLLLVTLVTNFVNNVYTMVNEILLRV